MARIEGIAGGMGPARRVARRGGGFALPEPRQADAAAGPAAGAGIGALLALQADAVQPAAPRDEAARRQAAATLEELRGLQLDLLRGVADAGRVARLAALSEAGATASDPVLQEALAELALRARIELARRRAGSASGR